MHSKAKHEVSSYGSLLVVMISSQLSEKLIQQEVTQINHRLEF